MFADGQPKYYSEPYDSDAFLYGAISAICVLLIVLVVTLIVCCKIWMKKKALERSLRRSGLTEFDDRSDHQHTFSPDNMLYGNSMGRMNSGDSTRDLVKEP